MHGLTPVGFYGKMKPFRYQKGLKMPAILVKDSPPELNDWLKAEARINRRSLSQQVLICLEWCMRTYGEAQFRNPFGASAQIRTSISDAPAFPTGADLAKRIASRAAIDSDTAEQMKRDAASIRKAKGRSFDYACFA